MVSPIALIPPNAAPGSRRRVPLGSARATYRWFVDVAGVERCHRFERGESRELVAENVARQLAAAGYVGRATFDPTRWGSR